METSHVVFAITAVLACVYLFIGFVMVICVAITFEGAYEKMIREKGENEVLATMLFCILIWPIIFFVKKPPQQP